MMRLTMSRAAAALLRALLALADAPAGSLRLVAYQATEWRALTLDGERHIYHLSLDGRADPAIAARLLDALDEHEFAIGASFVADIVGKRGEHSPGNSTELLIEALTIVA
jgi:hypothetical protein